MITHFRAFITDNQKNKGDNIIKHDNYGFVKI